MHIKPSTRIRQDYHGFSKFCHEVNEPVTITRNGEADLVVMSHEAFQSIKARYKLQKKLLVGEEQIADGALLVEHKSVMYRMRGRIDDSKV